MNVREVRYTTPAKLEYTRLLHRVKRKWGLRSAKKLSKQIHAALSKIQRYPFMHPVVEERPNLRKCVVTPQTSIFYAVEQNTIVVSSVFDNRQDPKSLNKPA